jgi:predicted permease
MWSVLQDLAHSARSLRRQPAFTATALLAIALGIGANAALFSVLDAVLLKPLPYPQAGRIVQVENSYAGVPNAIASPRQFQFWRERTNVFEQVTAHWVDHLNLRAAPVAELAPVALVTANFFRLYGARTIHGRAFDAAEDSPSGEHVAVLSNEAWRQRFASDPGVVGRTVLLGDTPYTVIGVLAPFPTNLFPERPGLFIPFRMDPNEQGRDSRLCSVTALLKPGVSLQAAQAQLRVAAENYRLANPKSMRPVDGFTAQPLQEALAGDLRPTLWILAGAVGLVLLIACANVSNLLLVRGAARRRELAIRAVMGAGRLRMVRQLTTESLALAMAGGALGLGLAWFAIRSFALLFPPAPLGAGSGISFGSVMASGAVVLDWRVLGFTLLASVSAAMLSGALPAWRGADADIGIALREGGSRSGAGRGRTRLLSLLIAVEMTLSVVLLIGAGLLIRTAAALLGVPAGFDPRNVVTMQTSLAGAAPADVDRLVGDGVQRIESLRGVEVAAASCCLPLETAWQLPYIVQGRPLHGRYHGFAGWTFVSPGYFDALRIPIRRGRAFTDRDTLLSPGVALVNETLAQRLWPDYGKHPGLPVERLLVGRTMGPAYDDDPVREIVGVVADVHDQALGRKPRAILYVPLAQVPPAVKALSLPLLPMAWIVRTRGLQPSLPPAIARELQSAGGNLPVARIRAMEEVMNESVAPARVVAGLMSLFAGMALLLAAIGIHGLLRFTIGQRIPELGVRVALGASRGHLLWTVAGRAALLVAGGSAIGLVLASALSRLLQSLLFGVSARDPLVFAAAPLILTVAALFSLAVPVFEATRLDPAAALRSD